jgi:hypothetical protein
MSLPSVYPPSTNTLCLSAAVTVLSPAIHSFHIEMLSEPARLRSAAQQS